MSPRHVVVDGSNIATEGRSLPSLQQLDDAVREFLAENPDDVVTVVVDASFGHRIDSSEQRAFDEAESAGEIVSPPAGAIGRGDAFLLRIADKTGATVLSNDSFQEFHGEYDWLFEKGRLIGGKPVPAVGWIFTPRSPVRGPKSREAVKEAKRKKPAGSADGDDSATTEEAPILPAKNKGRGRKSVERAIATATEEAVDPEDKSKRRRRRKGGTPPAEPVNEPMVFLQFVADHKLGDTVVGEVDSFSSHGAFVTVGLTLCYVPLQAMGDPPPRSAREVMARNERVNFVVQAFDPPRRGVELALPAFAHVAGAPTEETVEAEIGAATAEAVEAEPVSKPASRRGRPRASMGAAAEEAAVKVEPEPLLATAAGFRRNTRTTLPPAAERRERPAPPTRARPTKKQAAPAKKAVAAKKAEAVAKPAKKKAGRTASEAPAKPAKKKAAAAAAAPTKPAEATKKAGRASKKAAVKKVAGPAKAPAAAAKKTSAKPKGASRGVKKSAAARS